MLHVKKHPYGQIAKLNRELGALQVRSDEQRRMLEQVSFQLESTSIYHSAKPAPPLCWLYLRCLVCLVVTGFKLVTASLDD